MTRDLRPSNQRPRYERAVPRFDRLPGVLIIDGDGDWAVTDDPSATPDGYLFRGPDGGVYASDEAEPNEARLIPASQYVIAMEVPYGN